MSDKIVDRIRKLLALAANNDNQAERESALAKAHALLLEHNLTQADVADGEEQVIGCMRTETRYSATNPWARTVCSAIAELYFCKFTWTSTGKRKLVANFIGARADTEIAAAVAMMVLDYINRDLNAFLRARAGSGYSRSRLITDFTNGAATALYWRCEKMRKSAEEAPKTPGTALVVVDVYKQRLDAADAWIAANVELAPDRQRGMSNARTHAAFAGAETGRNVQLTLSTGSTAPLKRIG